MITVVMGITFSAIENWTKQLQTPYTREYLDDGSPFLRTKHRTSRWSYISILVSCNDTWLHTISSNLLSIHEVAESARPQLLREILRLNHEWAGVKAAVNDENKLYLSRAYPVASVTRADFALGLQIMLEAADRISITIDALPDLLKEVAEKVQEMADSNKEETQNQRIPKIPNCPSCQTPSTYIPQYYRFYCYSCERYL
jgi:hypothetical protein